MNGILKHSLTTQTSIEIIYLSKSGILTQRRIKVISIYENTIKAVCLLRKSRRTFRIDHILSASIPKSKRVEKYESKIVP